MNNFFTPQELTCGVFSKKIYPSLTHPSFIDNSRHKTGLFSERINYALEETDRWLAMLFDAVRDVGIEKNCDFIILSDHGQLGIVRTVCPNVFLKDAGYIKAGAVIESENVLNHAPTAAKILDIELEKAEGKAFDEILN